jgi:hypothetical protein
VSKGEVQVVDRVEEWEMNLERSCCCAIVGLAHQLEHGSGLV